MSVFIFHLVLRQGLSLFTGVYARLAGLSCLYLIFPQGYKDYRYMCYSTWLLHRALGCKAGSSHMLSKFFFNLLSPSPIYILENIIPGSLDYSILVIGQQQPPCTHSVDSPPSCSVSSQAPSSSPLAIDCKF